MHNLRLDHCDRCLTGRTCLQGDPKDFNDFICLCPSCHQGHRCKFSLQAFGSTLGSLLVESSKAVKSVYTTVVSLVFTHELSSNLCFLFTFPRPTPRKFGPGNYLLVVTCFNQAALFCLLFKLVEITFGISHAGSCKAVFYLLSVFTRVTYWLTSWITVGRLMTIFFPISSSLKNPHIAIGMSLATSIVLFGKHVHEIMHFTVIQHRSTAASICVTNFDSFVVSTYSSFK